MFETLALNNYLSRSINNKEFNNKKPAITAGFLAIPKPDYLQLEGRYLAGRVPNLQVHCKLPADVAGVRVNVFP